MTTMTTMTTWTPSSDAAYDALPGCAVVAADGKAIGTVTAVLHPPEDATAAHGAHFLLVHLTALRAAVGAEEIYVPELAIAQVAPGRVVLNVPTERLRHPRWAEQPVRLASLRRR